jgi:iron complex outermembrane receptor protein
MLSVREIVFYSALLISVPLSAQEKEVELDPVTITSSLSSVASSKTGRNIIVIKGDAFLKLPVHSIALCTRRGSTGTWTNGCAK